MATKNSKRAAARAAAQIVAASHATATLDPRVAADQQRRRSGAAGTHDDSNARRNAPGTYRTKRVGSRSAARRSAVRDWS